VDEIERLLKDLSDSPGLNDVLGPLDASSIGRLVRELDPDADGIFYAMVNVGAVFGVARTDGSRVAMKVNRRVTDETYLAQVQLLQSKLQATGFPAPRPLGRNGPITWEDWIADGTFRDAHQPAVRRAMARELARLICLATATGLRPRRLPQATRGALLPTLRDSLCTSESTDPIPNWIDRIVREARTVPVVGREVVGHDDWGAKHLRFDEGLRLTALYDWESITTGNEPSIIGAAACGFTFTEELANPVDLWPTADESLAFIEEYEQERGEPFSSAERATALAACVCARASATRRGYAHGRDPRSFGLAAFADRLLIRV